MHRRRLFRPLVGSVLVGLLVALAATSAGVAKFDPAVAADSGRATSHITPRALDTTPVTVMVQLAGESVAEKQAKQPDKRLSQAEKNKIKADLASKQNSIKPAIQNLGGTVLDDLQAAYNGISVSIAREPGRRPSAAVQRRRRPCDSACGTDECDERSVHRRPDSLERANRLSRQRHQGRDHRLRRRLHTRQLRWPRHRRRVQRGKRGRHAAGEPGALRALAARRSRAASTSSATTTTRARPTGRQHIPQPDPNPLDCNGHGSHVAGTRRGLRRPRRTARRTPGPYDADDRISPRGQVPDRPGRRPQGRPVRRPRLRLPRARRTSQWKRSTGRSRTAFFNMSLGPISILRALRGGVRQRRQGRRRRRDVRG